MPDNQTKLRSPEECATIDEVRHAIDAIDHDIVEAIGRRYDYVKTIMRFKATERDVRAPSRYQAVLDQRRKWASEAGLDPDVVERLYRDLIDYFIDQELATLNGDEAD